MLTYLGTPKVGRGWSEDMEVSETIKFGGQLATKQRKLLQMYVFFFAGGLPPITGRHHLVCLIR